MAFKTFNLDSETPITIYKRRGARYLRLSVTSAGQTKVTIPTWAPYKAGIEFAKSRYDWIKAQSSPKALLNPGQAIGKAHHLSFVPSASATSPSTRVNSTAITVTYPSYLNYSDDSVQQAAQSASIRALRLQAESLLPQRLEVLARKHDFSYQSVKIRQLKGRWGSCDHKKNIVLNLYLMQMPWNLIDYVLLHELTHTKILKHGPEFWASMETILPGVKDVKKQLRAYQPVVNGSPAMAMA